MAAACVVGPSARIVHTEDGTVTRAVFIRKGTCVVPSFGPPPPQRGRGAHTRPGEQIEPVGV